MLHITCVGHPPLETNNRCSCSHHFDTLLTNGQDVVKIGKELKSRAIVKSVYLKLTRFHIEHVIERYLARRHEIRHKTNYLKTMLYTSYHEMNPHISNMVRAKGILG